MAVAVLALGHRGSAGRAPENTLAGFHRALEVGADGVELDVRLTADGVAVVFHDDKLGRTAPGRTAVAARTFEELGDLDAGSWFGPGFADQRIPTLDNVLAAIGSHCTINVEMKPADDAEALALAAWNSVAQAGLAETILFSSFDWEILRALRALTDQARIGVLCAKTAGDSAFALAAELDAEALNPPVAAVNTALVRRAQAAGLGLWVWTVNEPELIDRLIGYPVAAIISDFPELVVDRLRRLRGIG